MSLLFKNTPPKNKKTQTKTVDFRQRKNLKEKKIVAE